MYFSKETPDELELSKDEWEETLSNIYANGHDDMEFIGSVVPKEEHIEKFWDSGVGVIDMFNDRNGKLVMYQVQLYDSRYPGTEDLYDAQSEVEWIVRSLQEEEFDEDEH